MRIEDGWRNCEFTHKGWIKEQSVTGKTAVATDDDKKEDSSK